MNLKTQLATIAAIAVAVSAIAADAPTPEQLIDRAIATQGGQEPFHGFGVLKLEVQSTETKPDGTAQKDNFIAYVDTSLRNMRLELKNGVIVVKNDDIGWATINGKLDQRNQTPRFSVSLNHEKLLPILLPYSLKMDRLIIGTTATPTTFAGENAWSFTVGFEKMFFVAPFIADRWEFFVARDDGRLLGARYLPRPEYSEVHPEGVQYRLIEFTTIDGVRVPTRMVMDGIDASGSPTGHVSEVTITPSALYEPGITYFLHPDKLAELEEDDDRFLDE